MFTKLTNIKLIKMKTPIFY